MSRFAHWEDIPRDFGSWPFKYFEPVEIACRGDGSIVIDEDAMTRLDMLRSRLGKPIRLTSAYRSPYHNALVGGAPRSQHLDGRAFDIALEQHDKGVIHQVAQSVGFSGFGMHYKTFIHVDTGPERSW